MKTAATLPVKENKTYEVDIVGLGHNGEGVGRIDGYTLFIYGAIPGDRVLAKVLKAKKQYGYAELIKVLEKGADRVDPSCPIYMQCGGCQIQHMSYEAQLKHKRQMVIDNLERIGKLKVKRESESHSDMSSGGVNHVIVHPTLGMEYPWKYRNKAQVPIGERDGRLIGGFYARGTHDIIDMEACLIQHEANDHIIRDVKNIAGQLGIPAYDEIRHCGLLRHVVVKIGFHTGEMMVVLVTNGENIPHVELLIEQIRKRHPQVVSICQNINTEKTNVIFGKQTKVLWGNDVIYDSIGDVRFAISARSFYQVNPAQTKVLYEKALEYANLNGEEIVIDAYCGIGTISLFLARHAKKVYGVEIVEEAIEDARRNAELNGISNVEFAVGKAEEVIPAWKEQGLIPDVIVVDPPRKGCDEALLRTIVEMRPKRVIYVSCNPSTLARDLRILEDGGFRTVEVQPVDMFPQTAHVECVARIQRADL